VRVNTLMDDAFTPCGPIRPSLSLVRAATNQVLEKHGYDGQQADVWSVGVVLYVLLAGYLPFNETTMATLFLKIKNGTPP